MMSVNYNDHVFRVIPQGEATYYVEKLIPGVYIISPEETRGSPWVVMHISDVAKAASVLSMIGALDWLVRME